MNVEASELLNTLQDSFSVTFYIWHFCSKFIDEIRRFRKNQGTKDPKKNILTQKESISSLSTLIRSQMPDVCLLLK